MTRLISLKMVNYRPFYGKDNIISFSTNPKKPFNIVFAGTGGGKTTILDAMAWCMYGKEIHKPDPYPMLNDRKRDELKKGETAGVQIEIIMGKSEKEIDCVLSRTVTFIKDERGVKPIDVSEQTKAKVKGPRNNLIGASFDVVVDRIFPEDIQHLFMFDGEALQKFFDEDNIENTKNAIIDITQIDFLKSTIKHLKEVSKSYKQDEEENPKIQEYKTLIRSVDKEIDRHNIEKKKTQENLDSAKKNYASALEKLKKIGAGDKDIKKLIEEEKKILEKLKETKKELDDLEEESFKHLLNSVPTLFCKKELKKAIKIIDEQYGSGELPPDPIKIDFLNKLLNEKKECICGTPLKKGSKERKKVEEYRDRAPLSKYEPEIRHGQGAMKVILSKTSNFLDERKKYYETIKKKTAIINDLNNQHKLKKKERKGLNEQELNSLSSERDFQFAEIERYNKRIGELNHEIVDNNKQKTRWDDEKRKLEKEQIKNKEQRKKFEICDIAITFFQKIKDELIVEVKDEIEKKTNELFKKGVDEPRVSEVQITDDFECRVLNKRGESIYGGLSSGQKEILAVSFMIALRKESGFDSPILFDYPWGRIDPEKTVELINSLKEVLKNVQVNFFLIRGREFTDSVKHHMKDYTGALYEIRKEKNKPESKVKKHERK